ncbi:hypothetical protein FQ775_24135 [Nitratireductor mangrovi]|uniref:Uncharacterized protein n=1 Tax=Nitratireductor mangrovi TaxID=2599600 RepID=A0A6H0DYF6_9HYPH|nr:hypothetical protein [Nitratireductor mangrovi]QIS94681.1 hypothetical protein FQ775_24135 [Nitratireductor mangrovi]
MHERLCFALYQRHRLLETPGARHRGSTDRREMTIRRLDKVYHVERVTSRDVVGG